MIDWFRGQSLGEFQGTLGRLQDGQNILVLSAGGKVLPLIKTPSWEPQQGDFGRLGTLTCLSNYDGTGGLPVTVEPLSFRLLKPGGSLIKWRGAFSGLDISDWGDDFDDVGSTAPVDDCPS